VLFRNAAGARLLSSVALPPRQRSSSCRSIPADTHFYRVAAGLDQGLCAFFRSDVPAMSSIFLKLALESDDGIDHVFECVSSVNDNHVTASPEKCIYALLRSGPTPTAAPTRTCPVVLGSERYFRTFSISLIVIRPLKLNSCQPREASQSCICGRIFLSPPGLCLLPP